MRIFNAGDKSPHIPGYVVAEDCEREDHELVEVYLEEHPATRVAFAAIFIKDGVNP